MIGWAAPCRLLEMASAARSLASLVYSTYSIAASMNSPGSLVLGSRVLKKLKRMTGGVWSSRVAKSKWHLQMGGHGVGEY